MSLKALCIVVAVVLFVIGFLTPWFAAEGRASKLNLMSLGLAFGFASFLL